VDRYLSEEENCENCKYTPDCYDRWYEMNRIHTVNEGNSEMINCWEKA